MAEKDKIAKDFVIDYLGGIKHMMKLNYGFEMVDSLIDILTDQEAYIEKNKHLLPKTQEEFEKLMAAFEYVEIPLEVVFKRPEGNRVYLSEAQKEYIINCLIPLKQSKTEEVLIQNAEQLIDLIEDME